MTVTQVAKVLGTTEQFVRCGIRSEHLPIGTWGKLGTKGRTTFLIVPTKLARWMGISMEELERRVHEVEFEGQAD